VREVVKHDQAVAKEKLKILETQAIAATNNYVNIC